MATSLTTFLRVIGNIRQTNAADLSTPADEVQFGVGTSGSAGMTTVEADWANGTSDSQANEWFHDTRTVAATTADNLDLAGSLTNKFGETLTFTTIKLIFVRILSPDGTKELYIGPRSQSNAWVGPWGDTTDFSKTKGVFLWFENYGVGSITAATTDVLGIYNNGSGSTTYDIILVGED